MIFNNTIFYLLYQFSGYYNFKNLKEFVCLGWKKVLSAAKLLYLSRWMLHKIWEILLQIIPRMLES